MFFIKVQSVSGYYTVLGRGIILPQFITHIKPVTNGNTIHRA